MNDKPQNIFGTDKGLKEYHDAWLGLAYKDYSNELLQLALTEIEAYESEDILEVPSDLQIPKLTPNCSISTVERYITVTRCREIPVYAIRRFLKQMIHGKNDGL